MNKNREPIIRPGDQKWEDMEFDSDLLCWLGAIALWLLAAVFGGAIGYLIAHLRWGL